MGIYRCQIAVVSNLKFFMPFGGDHGMKKPTLEDPQGVSFKWHAPYITALHKDRQPRLQVSTC